MVNLRDMILGGGGTLLSLSSSSSAAVDLALDPTLSCNVVRPSVGEAGGGGKGRNEKDEDNNYGDVVIRRVDTQTARKGRMASVACAKASAKAEARSGG